MFYDRFIELCNEKGVKPAHVARELEINQSTVSMWKSQGTAPNAATLVALANYFKTTPAYLMGNKLAKHPPSEPKQSDTSNDVETNAFLDKLLPIKALYKNIGVEMDFDFPTKRIEISVVSRDTGKEQTYRAVIEGATSGDEAFKLREKEIMDFIISAAARVSE